MTNIHTSTSSPAKISSYWLYYSATEGTRPFYSCIFIRVNLNLNVLHSAPQGGKRGCFLSACRPVLTLRRQGSKQLQRQETISIDSGFPFLCSHSRREGLFKITELVMIRCKVLLPTVYFVLPVIYEGPFFVCVCLIKDVRLDWVLLTLVWMKEWRLHWKACSSSSPGAQGLFCHVFLFLSERGKKNSRKLNISTHTMLKLKYSRGSFSL